MSRSSYSDDYGDEFPGQLELFRANVMRSIYSKKGQARLRELRDALMAMAVKELESSVFVRPTGEACALGQWAKARLSQPEIQSLDVEDDYETAAALGPLGWPKLVVMDVIYANDSDHWVNEPECEGPHRRWTAYDRHWDCVQQCYVERWPVICRRLETPKERYVRVLAWVNEHIAERTTQEPSNG